MTAREEEAHLLTLLQERKQNESVRTLVKYLTLRRGRYLERLEKEESNKVRGKSLECKDLIQKLS